MRVEAGLLRPRLSSGCAYPLSAMRRVERSASSARSVARDLVPVHVRQPDVAEDDVGPELAGLRDPGPAVGARRARDGPPARSTSARDCGRVDVVLDDEDPTAARPRQARWDAGASGSGARREREASRRTPRPRPGPSLRARTAPPCSSTSPFTSASPRPSPPFVRASLPSACTNGSNRRGRSSGGMPDAVVAHADLGPPLRHGPIADRHDPALAA